MLVCNVAFTFDCIGATLIFFKIITRCKPQIHRNKIFKIEKEKQEQQKLGGKNKRILI